MTKVAEAGGFDELRRHWRILPPCMLGITLCSVHGYSLGVMIPPLEKEFGWPRAEISGGLLLISVIALVAAPMVGMAVDRFGPRRIALSGILLFCTTLGLLSTATADIRSWWALWALLAVGNMFILPTVWAQAINGYFDRARGKALALALCGTGVAAFFVPSLTNWLVERHGWRDAYIGLALLGALITFPLAFALFRPREVAPVAAGAATQPPGLAGRGVSVRQGLRMPSFLKLAAATVIYSVALCALTTNCVPVLIARGMSSTEAAALAGLLGIGSITGRLVGGFLLDRFDAAKVAAASVLMPVIAVLLLLSMPGNAAAGVACLIVGLSVGTEVDCCAYLAARHFGLKSFGTLFGAMNGMMLFGNGLAPVVANHVYDVTKSYTPTLWFQIPACLITALLFLWLGPYPQFAEAEEEPAPSAEPVPAI
jgi:predicted MFS family arabinose efflux permease